MKSINKISIMTILAASIMGGITFASTGTVTTDGLRMRKDASKESEIVTSLNNGAQVEIVEKTGDWYKVKYYDEYEGYLYSEYVKVNGEETVGSAPQGDTQTDTEEPVEIKPEENRDEEISQEDENQDEEPAVNIEEVEEIVYPVETTIKTTAKVYILPLITSTSISEMAKDTKITVEKELNDWIYISTEEITGWIRKYYIETEKIQNVESEQTEQGKLAKQEEKAPEKAETTVDEKTPNISKGYINVNAARIRKEASTTSDILEVLTLNTEVKITAETDEWYKIQFDDITGYISRTLISEKATQTSRGDNPRQPEVQNTKNEEITEAVKEKTENKPEIEEAQKQETVQETVTEEKQEETTVLKGQKVADFAKQYIGYKYVYGGTTPSTGFDCSGFVYYVFNSCGHSLSRSCSVQARSGIAISKANLEVGDLVFFNNTSDGTIGHVGIYIGDGNFVHASTPTKGVRIDTLNSGYYDTYYYSARRVI